MSRSREFVSIAVGLGMVISGCSPRDAGIDPSGEKRSPIFPAISEPRPIATIVAQAGQTPEPETDILLTEAGIEQAKKRREEALDVLERYIQDYYHSGGDIVLFDNPSSEQEFGNYWLKTGEKKAQVIQQDDAEKIDLEPAQNLSFNIQYSANGVIENVEFYTDHSLLNRFGDVVDEKEILKPNITSREFFDAAERAVSMFYVLPEGLELYEIEDRGMEPPDLTIMGKGRYPDGRTVQIYASRTGTKFEVSYPPLEQH